MPWLASTFGFAYATMRALCRSYLPFLNLILKTHFTPIWLASSGKVYYKHIIVFSNSGSLLGVCVPFIINQTPAAGGDHCHGPQRAALSGLWGEPTPYVCMYVSMVCGMYVGMYWVRRESTQVHREGGTVISKGKKCSVCDHDGASSQGAGYVRWCSGASLSARRPVRFGLSPVVDQLDPV